MPSIVFALLSDLHGRLLDPSPESEDCQQFLASAWSVSIIIVLHHTRLLSTISPLWTCSATRDRICSWRLCNGLVYFFKTNLPRVIVTTPVVLRAWSDFVCALFRRLSELFLSTSLRKNGWCSVYRCLRPARHFLVRSGCALTGWPWRYVIAQFPPNLLLLYRWCYWLGMCVLED